MPVIVDGALLYQSLSFNFDVIKVRGEHVPKLGKLASVIFENVSSGLESPIENGGNHD